MKTSQRLLVVALVVGLVLTCGAMTVSAAGPVHIGATDYATIQAAIDAATAGDTITVDAGTYNENIDVHTRVQIVGAGSGTDPAANTIITADPTVSGDTKVGVVQLTASGASAADPILFQDMRVEPVGMAGFSVGRFTEATGQSVSYVKLDNVKVVGTNQNPNTEQERGLYVDLTSSLSGLVVDGCSFDECSYGWYFQKAVSADASDVSDVSVTDTSFSHNNHKGIYVEKLSDATFTRLSVTGNGYDSGNLPGYFSPWSAGVDLNLKAGTYSGFEFVDCTMWDNATNEAKEGVALTVKGRGTGSDSSYAGFPAYVDDVAITGGSYTDNERGIRLGEPGKGNTTPTNVVIRDATISGNVQHYSGSDGSAYGGVINATTVAVDARGNYWGADAPAAGDIQESPGDVATAPWLMAAAPTTQYGTDDSIQGAIDFCPAGNTINVWPGTYNEDLAFNKSLTVQGYMRGTYTVDTTGKSGYNNAGAYVSVDSVTIMDMVLDLDGSVSTPRYGLKLGEVDGALLENVTVTDAYRSGFDLLGTTNTELTNISALGNGGHGVAMCDVTNITVTGLTSTGNGWSPVSIGTWGRYSPIGTTGVVLREPITFDGLVFQIEEGSYAGPEPYPISVSTVQADGADVTVPAGVFTYALSGDDDEWPSNQRTYLFADYAAAAAAAEIAPLGHLTGNYYVQDLADQSQFYVTSDTNCSIQAAVDAASSGDTVHVKAGTYVEQVVIGKDLTVKGEGDTSVIQSPDELVEFFHTSADNYAIVLAKNDATVTLDSLKIDGAGKGNANYKFVGIGFRQAGGTVQNCSFVDVRDTPFSGSQHGVGLYAYNTDGQSRAISVLDNTFVGFQKTAMALNADEVTPLTVDVQRNVITGQGATDVTAQNGIQIYGRAITGLVKDNTVTGIGYSGSGWVGSAILNMYSSVDVKDNTVNDSHMGVYLDEANCTVSGNTLNIAKMGSSGTGVRVTDPDDALPSPFVDDELLSSGSLKANGYGLKVTDKAIVKENTITLAGIDRVGTSGVCCIAGWSDRDLDVEILDNVIDGFQVGAKFCTGSGAGVYQRAEVHGNDLGGNDWGVYSFADYFLVNAESNWWGAASGPSGVGPGSGCGVSNYVDYSPWYGDEGGTWSASSNASGQIEIPADMDRAEANALIASAPEGATIVLLAGTQCHDGGLLLTSPGITVTMAPGACITTGSPAVTVSAANITLQGIMFYGGLKTDPAIVVASGGDNLTIEDCEIEDWTYGVQILDPVTSFKMVGNFVHGCDAGLKVDAASLAGVVTVEGNLFKANNLGVDSAADIDVSYNSWGMLGDPAAKIGGTGAVTYAPWTFAELFMDVAPDLEAADVTVRESELFTVALKIDAADLTGFTFKLNYDTDEMTLQSKTWAAPFAGNATDLDGATPVDGQESYRVSFNLPDPPVSGDGLTVVELCFLADGGAGVGPWDQYFDISHVEAETSAGAAGGVKVFVNNAGYAMPSAPDRDISDTNDGHVRIKGIANFTGFVDLQGRANDAGATIEVSEAVTLKASATSASSGAWTSAHETGELLVVGTSYDIVIDAVHYLPTSVKTVTLDDRPLDILANCKLLGGDANDDDAIGIDDVSLIGGEYGKTSGFNANADVNIDGVVNIQDLVLAAGNFDLTESPWTL